jgi:hypothetical protein
LGFGRRGLRGRSRLGTTKMHGRRRCMADDVRVARFSATFAWRGFPRRTPRILFEPGAGHRAEAAIFILTFRVAIKGGLGLYFLPGVFSVVRGSQSHWHGPCVLAARMNHGGRGGPGGRGEAVLTKRRIPSFNRLVLKFSNNPTAQLLRRK